MVSSIPRPVKKMTIPSPMPPSTHAIRSIERPVTTVSPIRYSEKAPLPRALGHSRLVPLTRAEMMKEIQPATPSSNGSRSTPRWVIIRNAGTRSRHTTDRPVTAYCIRCRPDVAPMANTASCPISTGSSCRIPGSRSTPVTPAKDTCYPSEWKLLWMKR